MDYSDLFHRFFFQTGAFGDLEACKSSNGGVEKFNNLNFSCTPYEQVKRTQFILLWLKGMIAREIYMLFLEILSELPHECWNIGFDPNTNRKKLYLEFDRRNGIPVPMRRRKEIFDALCKYFPEEIIQPVLLDNLSSVGFDISEKRHIDVKIYAHKFQSFSKVYTFFETFPYKLKNFAFLSTSVSKRQKCYFQFSERILIGDLIQELGLCSISHNFQDILAYKSHIITYEGIPGDLKNSEIQIYYITHQHDSELIKRIPVISKIWDAVVT